MHLPEPVPELPAALVSGAIVLRDREAILPLLPRGAVICEVGVALGTFSRKMIEICEPRHFIAIDHFKIHHQPELWGKPTAEWFDGKTHGDFYRDSFSAEITAGTVTVIEAESDAGIAGLDDASVDIFYIDGDHSYDAVRRDLAAAATKLRPDGYLILNDYILVDHLGADIPYGVIYAAHEFMIEHNWVMRYLALQTSMFCDVVLRRADGKTGMDTAPRAAADAVDAARALQLENAALRREILTLRKSTSWRVTAPLRAVKNLLRAGP